MQSEFNLKPMSIGGILDLTFKIYRGNFVAISLYSLLIGGVASLVVNLLNSGASLFEASSLLPLLTQGASIDQILPTLTQAASAGDSILASIASLVVGIFVTPLVTGGITLIALGACYGKQYHGRNALQLIKGMVGKLIGTNLAMGVCIFAVMIVFAIVTFLMGLLMISAETAALFTIVMVLLVVALLLVFVPVSAFYFPVAIHEERFGFGAFFRSIGLFFSKFWRSLAVLLLSGLIVSVLQFTVSAVQAFFPAIVQAIISALLSGILQPVTLIAMVLLYMDILMRKEGLDLEMQAAEVNAPPADMFVPEKPFENDLAAASQPETPDATTFYASPEGEEKQE